MRADLRPSPREVVGGACQDAADGDGGLRTRASGNERLATPSGPVPNDDHVKLGLLLGQPPSHPLLGRGSRSERHLGLPSGTCD